MLASRAGRTVSVLRNESHFASNTVRRSTKAYICQSSFVIPPTPVSQEQLHNDGGLDHGQNQQRLTSGNSGVACQQKQRHTVLQQSLQAAAAMLCAPLLLLLPCSTADAKLPPTRDPASNVGSLTNKEVDKRRQKSNFIRAYDGHVVIQNKFTKQWTDVKCDLQVPGLLLLRDSNGEVFYLGYAGLKQVDLSDDQVVAAIALDDWENAMRPVEGLGADGQVERLQLTRDEFYQLVSLISGQEDFEVEVPAQQGDAAGGGGGGGGGATQRK